MIEQFTEFWVTYYPVIYGAFILIVTMTCVYAVIAWYKIYDRLASIDYLVDALRMIQITNQDHLIQEFDDEIEGVEDEEIIERIDKIPTREAS